MAPSDDPADAADRLEQALERIEELARRRPMKMIAPVPVAPAVVDVSARLDSVIANLRSALRASGT